MVNYFAKEETEEAHKEQSVDAAKHTKEAHIDKFYNSIKSRLILAEVIKRLDINEDFNEDLICKD